MKWSILLVLLILALSTCRRPYDKLVKKSTHRSVLIVIPGYYGSALRETKSKRRVFITVKEALFGKNALSLLNDELQTPSAPTLEVDGVLEKVTVLPGIYSVDVYAKWIDRLRAKSGLEIIPFAYDWRQDLVATAQRLHATIESLKDEGVEDISLAAHSMGGLVATYYLAYGAQELATADLDWRGAKNIRRAAYFGVPFRGVFAIFRNMVQGVCFSRNCRLLTSETVASFPASYQLMNTANAEYLDRHGKPHKLSLADIEFWKRLKIGLMGGNVSDDIFRKREAYTRIQLERAQQFAKALDLTSVANTLPKNISFLNVTGIGHKTLKRVYQLEEGEKMVFDVDHPEKYGLPLDPIMADGDKTVTLDSAEIPATLVPATTTIRTEYAHDRLFHDPKVHERFLLFLAKR